MKNYRALNSRVLLMLNFRYSMAIRHFNHLLLISIRLVQLVDVLHHRLLLPVLNLTEVTMNILRMRKTIMSVTWYNSEWRRKE